MLNIMIDGATVTCQPDWRTLKGVYPGSEWDQEAGTGILMDGTSVSVDEF